MYTYAGGKVQLTGLVHPWSRGKLQAHATEIA